MIITLKNYIFSLKIAPFNSIGCPKFLIRNDSFMIFQYSIALLLMLAAITGSAFYLVKMLKNKKPLLSLVGLFCLAMGIFLLILDLLLISLTHGPQYIPDYLLFNRLVSDSGFAGRWVLTVYVFISTGFAISIYLLARNLITKFNNNTKTDDES